MQPEDFVTALRTAAPYIHAHRGRTFVVALPGETLAKPQLAQHLYDLALLRSLGVKLILVLGARPQIDLALRQNQRESQFSPENLRITAKADLPAIKAAVGSVRIEIEAILSAGMASTPMAGAHLDVLSGNFISAQPLGVRHGIDHQYTGVVRSVDVAALRHALSQNAVILLSPLGYSPSGEVFNVGYEDVAISVASALQADKLIVFNSENLENYPRELTLDQLHILPNTWRDMAKTACARGVNRVHFIPDELAGGSLLELYRRDGCGVMIHANAYERLRAATPKDIGGILGLLAPLEQAGIVLPRSRKQLELDIGHYWVIERDQAILGCCALLPYPPETRAAEFAAVAVHPDAQRKGYAARLLNAVEQKAREHSCTQLWALTVSAEHWFLEHGFVEQSLAALPDARRHHYKTTRNAKIFCKNL